MVGGKCYIWQNRRINAEEKISKFNYQVKAADNEKSAYKKLVNFDHIRVIGNENVITEI